MLLVKQSYSILEQKSPHIFHLRAGRGRLDYSSHKPDVQNHRQNLGCVTVMYAHRWASAHHQGVGTGDRFGVEPTSTKPDTSQPHHILRLARLACVVLKLPEQTARCQLCSRAPLTPSAHFSQLRTTLHLNSDFCCNSCF